MSKQEEVVPPDLIAWKWAKTLPEHVGDVLLAKHVRELQAMINNALSPAPSISDQAQRAAKRLVDFALNGTTPCSQDNIAAIIEESFTHKGEKQK